jgi:hypothetical protein
MVELTNNIEQNIITNDALFDLVFENLKKLGITFNSKIYPWKMTQFGCSSLAHISETAIAYPKDLFWYKSIMESDPRLIKIMSQTIGVNFEKLTQEHQILIFNTFGFLHEFGHAKWGEKLWPRYSKKYNKTITSKMLISRKEKHEKNVKKFNIHHRDCF